MNALTLAALGTGFTFLMTTLGAAMVFFFRKAVRMRSSPRSSVCFWGLPPA